MPALREHPQLPVRAEALQLAVRAELHEAAGVADRLGALRDADVVEVVLGGHRAAARSRVDDVARREREQPLVLPDVRVLVPVVLADRPP